MAETYDVLIRVKSTKGHCGTEHKVGQEWLVGDKTPDGICLPAFAAILPDIRALMFGGSFPWADATGASLVTCADPKHPVVFELRRVPKKQPSRAKAKK